MLYAFLILPFFMNLVGWSIVNFRCDLHVFHFKDIIFISIELVSSSFLYNVVVGLGKFLIIDLICLFFSSKMSFLMYLSYISV